MRVNKTEKNLRIVWEQLDNASGELYNALDNLSRMTGLSDHTKRLTDMIDISRIDLLKEEIEQLIEAKKELPLKEAYDYIRTALEKNNFQGLINCYEDIEDFCMWNQIDQDHLDWDYAVSDWDKQISEEEADNGFIVCQAYGDKTYVLCQFDEISIKNYIRILFATIKEDVQ